MKQAFILIVILVSVICQGQSLIINEVMPKNGSALYDGDGDNEDWVEIYNPSGASISLIDYYLSDDQDDKLKWRMPNVTIPSGDFVLIFCSGKNQRSGEYHSNFKLGNSTTTIGIYLTNGAKVHELTYDSMPENISYGPQTDGGANLVFYTEHTAGYSNVNVNGYSCFTPNPSLNKVSGYYNSPLQVQSNSSGANTVIRYTQDGQTPTDSSPVFTSTSLTTSTVNNVLSLIPTNPALGAPVAGYTVLRMNNRGYLPPSVDGQNVNVLTLKAYENGCVPSKAVQYTYVLNNGQVDYGDMPIMSLNIDNKHLFDADSGMYVFGNHSEGNYMQRGEEWEREGRFQFFDEVGDVLIDQRIGVELHGNGSRHSTHKNLRLSAKTRYGKNTIDNTVLPESRIGSYKNLIVRSAGHRPDCMPRDEFATEIVKDLIFDYQHYRTGVLYINGEYWGINTIKERLNEDYIAAKYDLNEEEISILQNSGNLYFGKNSDSLFYSDLIDYVTVNDLTEQQHYTHVVQQMDMDNYVQLMASQVYMGNGDWPYNNMRFWRKRVDYNPHSSWGHDGRLRWMFFDSDGSFGGTCESVSFTINNLERALRTDSIYEEYTRLFVGLMQHENVRTEYINMSCDLLNSSFLPQVVLDKFNAIEQALTPEMQRHVERFGYPSVATTLQDRMQETPSLTKWNSLVEDFRQFSHRRPFYVRRQMMREWGVGDTNVLTVNVNDQSMGEVKVNSLLINADLPGVSPAVYPWSGIYFDGVPLTLKAIAKPGYKFKNWMPSGNTNSEITIALNGDQMEMAVFEVDPDYVPLMPLVINELLADNENGETDWDNGHEDWFEVYNPNNRAVDLNGYYLTDNPDNLTKYKLGPNEVMIDALGFILFWADDQSGQGVWHTNFKLSKDGEYIALVEPDGQTIMSEVTFGPQSTDISYGSEVDGTQPWIDFIYPTPGYSNLKTSVAEAVNAPVSLYPNPVNTDEIRFNQVVSGTIYSSSGVALMEFEQANRVKVDALATGAYFVKLPGTAQVISFVKL